MIPLSLTDTDLNFAQTSAERTINWYAEKIGDKKFALRTMPGLKLLSAMGGNGGGRGLHCMESQNTELSKNQYLFALRGASFQEWDGVNFIERGRISTVVGEAYIANNGKQIMITDGVQGWGYTVGDPLSFAKLTLWPLVGKQIGAQFGSLRFISFGLGTGEFACSAQDDVFTWGGGGVGGSGQAEAETFPDPIVAIAFIGVIGYLLGTSSFEVWADEGAANIPWRRVQVGADIGCVAPKSVRTYGGSVFFLGGSLEGRGMVYQMDGYTPKVISDQRISAMIQALPNIEDAVGFIYQEQGHSFYRLNFQDGDKTFSYDLSTGLWAEGETRNPTTGVTSRRPEVDMVQFQGLNLVQDFRDGSVYEMSKKYYTDNGDPVVHTKVFPVFPDEQEARSLVPPFAAFLEMGNAGEGAEEPVAMLSASDDRGKTWGSESYRNLGKQGDYKKRVIWHGQGSTFGRNYKLAVTGNQEFILRGAGLLDEMMK